MTHAQQIAEQIAGRIDWRSDAFGWCVCPGRELHTSASNHKECRIRVLKENGISPGVYCLHASCAAACAERSHELRSALAKMELREGIVHEFRPTPPPPQEAVFSQSALEKYTSKITQTIDENGLRSGLR